MIIGIPKEIKDNEYRVAVVPNGVEALKKGGHRIVIEKSAGEGSAICDKEFKKAGAEILPSNCEVFEQADMIIKVKEPLEPEIGLLKKGQILFTFLHLASNEKLTRELLKRKIVGIAYETIETDDGQLPILIPMSEVAGRLSVQEGAKYLERSQGGRGLLLGGVPGVMPAKVLILGGGTVGTNAAKIAAGMGAEVVILEKNVNRLRYLEDVLHGRVTTRQSDEYNIREALKDADLLICAILSSGKKTPYLITRDMLKLMKTGSVIVDVSIDQGGAVETSRPTTHSQPIYKVDGIVHYCVANLPGCVPRTSTFALANVVLPYALEIANKGYRKALLENRVLARGLNVYKDKLTLRAVAELFGISYTPLEEVVK